MYYIWLFQCVIVKCDVIPRSIRHIHWSLTCAHLVSQLTWQSSSLYVPLFSEVCGYLIPGCGDGFNEMFFTQLSGPARPRWRSSPSPGHAAAHAQTLRNAQHLSVIWVHILSSDSNYSQLSSLSPKAQSWMQRNHCCVVTQVQNGAKQL